MRLHHINAFPDDPPVSDPERDALRGLDDATVATMRTDSARAEITSRLRFETQWCGEFSNGLQTRSQQAPPMRGAAMSREMLRRQEWRKLMIQSRSPNKAERNAAKYLLKACYPHSLR